MQEALSLLQREKAEMELLMQMTAEHSDSVADELYSTVEATQRESEERFAVITNTVPVPIIVTVIGEGGSGGALGIGVGDRVGILLPQRPETAISHIGLYKLGAIAIPLFLYAFFAHIAGVAVPQGEFIRLP
mgnify:CR=1 FL=1